MSQLSDFVRNASQAAFSVIGASSVAIGADGNPVACILNESESRKEFTEQGMEVEKTLRAVIRRFDWTSQGYSISGHSYVNKVATIAGERYRVEACMVGASFVILDLAETTRV
jgi:hypothetical protein